MGGLQFADWNVSRIGIERDVQDLKAEIPFTVSLNNPYPRALTGQAEWVLDTSAFSVQPQRVDIQVPARGSGQYHFTLKMLQDTVALQSLPRLGIPKWFSGSEPASVSTARFLSSGVEHSVSGDCARSGRPVDGLGGVPASSWAKVSHRKPNCEVVTMRKTFTWRSPCPRLMRPKQRNWVSATRFKSGWPAV